MINFKSTKQFKLEWQHPLIMVTTKTTMTGWDIQYEETGNTAATVIATNGGIKRISFWAQSSYTRRNKRGFNAFIPTE